MAHPPRHTSPQRTCVGCRRRRDKDELLRLARTPGGLRFDPDQRLPGRGAYVCPDPVCVDLAARRDGQAVRRALRGAPEEEVRAALSELRGVTDGHDDGSPPRTVKERNA